MELRKTMPQSPAPFPSDDFVSESDIYRLTSTLRFATLKKEKYCVRIRRYFSLITVAKASL